MQKSSFFSISLLKLVICLFDDNCTNICEIIGYYGLDLHFPDDYMHLCMFLLAICTYSLKIMSIWLLCPCFFCFCFSFLNLFLIILDIQSYMGFQYLYILQSDHHKSSNHLSPYIVIMILTIFPIL